MGWKRKSMGWMAAGTPPRRLSNAKTQTAVGVRFNGLPYSAQGRAACTLPPARRGGYPASRRNGHHAPKPHSEAGDPIGVGPSITAGEPWANPRTSPNQRWDPMGSNFTLPRTRRRHTHGQRDAITGQGPVLRIPVPARRRDEVRPPWGRNSVGFLSAGAPSAYPRL